MPCHPSANPHRLIQETYTICIVSEFGKSPCKNAEKIYKNILVLVADVWAGPCGLAQMFAVALSGLRVGLRGPSRPRCLRWRGSRRGLGEGAGWPVSLLNSLMGFGRACAPARSRRVAVGRVSAGLRILAVSPWPLV